jgi:hypothetical protein
VRPRVLVVLRRLPLLVTLLVVVSTNSRCSNVAGSVGAGGGAGPCTTSPVGDDDSDDGGDDDSGSPCAPPDSDGINGGCYAFDLTVDDTTFSPIILKAQNLGQVTLHLTNMGTKPHDFVVGCIPVSYPGCPSSTCFPSAADIAPVAPGATATATFTVPNPEGIYTFRSDVAGDSTLEADGGMNGLWGQFVVQ